VNIGSHDASVRDYGYAGGLDYRITPDTTVGFAMGGAGTDWTIANALGTGRSDVFQGGIYGSRAGAPPTCRRRSLMRRIGCRPIAS